MKPDRETASYLAEVLAGEPDFATEHCDLTVGDHERGGPEGVPEPESPKGYGGADIHRSRRPRTEHKAVVMALQEPHTAPPKRPWKSRPTPAPLIKADPGTPSIPPPLSDAPPTPLLDAPPTPTAPDPTDPTAAPDPAAAVEPAAALEPIAIPEPEPDFATEHRHMTVSGSDAYRTRRH